MTTAIFLFSDHSLQACECGKFLGGSYVELDDEPEGSARARMLELRGTRWSHVLQGALSGLISPEEDLVRRTHQRLPANPPGGEACFCGGLGRPYAWALARDNKEGPEIFPRTMFFGPQPWGPAVRERELMTETPIGATCLGCEEAIEEQDAGVLMPHVKDDGLVVRPWHRECYLRGLVGSVGHQQRRCPCYGGTEEDPNGLTKREAAKAAFMLAQTSVMRIVTDGLARDPNTSS